MNDVRRGDIARMRFFPREGCDLGRAGPEIMESNRHSAVGEPVLTPHVQTFCPPGTSCSRTRTRRPGSSARHADGWDGRLGGAGRGTLHRARREGGKSDQAELGAHWLRNMVNPPRTWRRRSSIRGARTRREMRRTEALRRRRMAADARVARAAPERPPTPWVGSPLFADRADLASGLAAPETAHRCPPGHERVQIPQFVRLREDFEKPALGELRIRGTYAPLPRFPAESRPSSKHAAVLGPTSEVPAGQGCPAGVGPAQGTRATSAPRLWPKTAFRPNRARRSPRSSPLVAAALRLGPDLMSLRDFFCAPQTKRKGKPEPC